MPKYVTYDDQGNVESFGTTMPETLTRKKEEGQRILAVDVIPGNVVADYHVVDGHLKRRT
jgi:hypothetical protein